MSEKSVNALPPKPPIPATSQAKSKLKTFQFVTGQPEQAEGNGDEEVGTESRAASAREATNHNAAENKSQLLTLATSDNTTDKATTATPQLPKANTYPCTPGMRLPLEDLIGNFDESAHNVEPTTVSPEEHIGWIPNSSSALLTPNRKRKRARSSSPSCPNTSSQRQETSTFLAGAAQQPEKETQEMDATTDLWNRYGTGRQEDNNSHLPGLSHLMFQASPRPLETPAKNAGLRRWASTGNDWPTSKSKRRRTNGKGTIVLWQDEQAAEPGGKSKVAAMVDKIQETLASQNLANSNSSHAKRIEGPSSSSPLPDVGAADSFDSGPAVSPLHTKQDVVPKSIAVPLSKPTTGTRGATGQKLYQNSKSSQRDYRHGQPPDAVISAPLHLQSKAPLPAYKRPSIKRTQSSDTSQCRKVPAQAQTTVRAADEELNYFGDDLDLTAEDLDELMSQPQPVDENSLPEQRQFALHPARNDTSAEQPRETAQANKGTLQAAQAMPLDDLDDDDEFGCNELDEDLLAQVEMKATQAFRASHPQSKPSSVKSR